MREGNDEELEKDVHRAEHPTVGIARAASISSAFENVDNKHKQQNVAIRGGLQFHDIYFPSHEGNCELYFLRDVSATYGNHWKKGWDTEYKSWTPDGCNYLKYRFRDSVKKPVFDEHGNVVIQHIT